MFGSNVLEVAIGLALVYLLLSLVAAAVRELIAGVLRTRGKHLRDGIVELMYGDARLVQALYEHPQIYALFQGRLPAATGADGTPTQQTALQRMRSLQSLPSYIPASNFALALMDVATRGTDVHVASQAGAEATPLTTDSMRRQITNLGAPPVQRLVLSAIDSAQGDLGRVQHALERWFDSAMDRVSGGYKRRTQYYLFAIGIVLTMALDADTKQIADRFYRDPALRQRAVAMAEQRTTGGTPATPADASPRAAVDTGLADLATLSLPLSLPDGWSDFLARARRGWFGWLVTAFAISLGAPFWFDTLNKVMVIRSTVKPREKSPEEGSQDRQPARVGLVSGAGGARPPQVHVAVASPAPPPAPPAHEDPRFGGFAHQWSAGDPEGGVL
ncbi:MAG TPA: hypothetical protein VEA99_04980 [Gemmatimonadaceae bacterium]|nr:hypothetical protein [Gemmatimonadaceae bacterium]